MYAQKSEWSILKKWCSEKFREVGGWPRLQECFLSKAASGKEFGRLQHWRASASASHVHFSGTNYSHVKHRKCREQSLAVGRWSNPSDLRSGRSCHRRRVDRQT